ncbi:LPXTG cell wall anchor domain-containing protein [Hyphomicrobium sp.]|uniref:LPXTG cell wall anchor domain-containing protein n=1 Tax=Hyphomicrobium sp. TaxID=82 RepID=UPI0025BD7CD7|nr:LPXTG cell wall anchor domain-containing protein [Hyphomicrobium sp.]MCC7252843.1 LPXTG cell wall anchor domain-containing protein [Hyphomicrobium sp.]
MVRLPKKSRTSKSKFRATLPNTGDLESTMYTILLIVAAVLLMGFVLNTSNHMNRLKLPPSVPTMTL